MGYRDEFSLDHLKSGIGRCLDDTASPFIKQLSLATFGNNDWKQIIQALKLWETQGYLKILEENIEAVDSDVICVEMLSYIDRKSPIPGFLNHEDTGASS